MKRCPTCQATYADESLNFCRHDGAALIPFHSESATAVLATGSVAGTATQKTTALGRGSAKPRTINSLAVLPFENMSRDPNAEYLSDGITESIINSLSQLRKLRVMARSTVFRYKGQPVDPQQVGRDLDVRAVLSGRVLQLGDDLIIGAELVKVSDGSQLWGEQYKRKLSDIFEVQEEIASEISGKLRLRLTGEQKKRLTRRHTESTEAYQAYLRGRYYWNRRTEEGLKKGIEYFQQAIEKDPGYALAYAGLADSYGRFEYFGYLSSKETMPRAKAAAMKALEVDDTLTEARTSLAWARLHYDWDWLAAEREFKRAIDLNPDYTEAHHSYSHYLIAMGRTAESLAESKRALELDPLDLVINAHLGWHYLYARQYDQSIEQSRRTLELEPNSLVAHWFLGRALEQKAMYQEAAKAFEKSITISDGSPTYVAALGHAYAVSGKKSEALRILNELKQQSKRTYVSPFNLAAISSGLGEKDQGFEWLEKAFEERSHWLVYLKVEPMLDGLRSDPRFTDLVRRVGLPK